MKTIIYIHGFNSSPGSEKAKLTEAFFAAQTCGLRVHVAKFPSEPERAIAALKSVVEDIQLRNVAGFIGSSLGGYYSVYLSWFFDLPAALINPALKPYELLGDYLGENVNPYTGERYVVTEAHMQQLRELDVAQNVKNEQFYIVTQTGDEVLDYRQAMTCLPCARYWIWHGGNHAFEQFEACLPSISDFFSTKTSLSAT